MSCVLNVCTSEPDVGGGIGFLVGGFALAGIIGAGMFKGPFPEKFPEIQAEEKKLWISVCIVASIFLSAMSFTPEVAAAEGLNAAAAAAADRLGQPPTKHYQEFLHRWSDRNGRTRG